MLRPLNFLFFLSPKEDRNRVWDGSPSVTVVETIRRPKRLVVGLGDGLVRVLEVRSTRRRKPLL